MVRLMNNKGFSLIEVAIGIILVGLLTLPLIEVYKIQAITADLNVNLAKFNDARSRINNFVVINDRYPRPASLTAAPDDVEFGIEVPLSPAIDDCDMWPTPQGVCRVVGHGILIGAIPTKAIGSDNEAGTDRWGNKILYAVTEAETTTYNSSNGIIEVVPVNTTPFTDFADFILVSHGESALGAYTFDGANVSLCAAAGTGRDRENCDFDEVFIMHDANMGSDLGLGAALSLSAGAEFYDDYTFHQNQVPLDIWNPSLLDTITFPNSDLYALTQAERIGIGTSEPDAKLHVVGDLGADEVMSDNICRNGGSCFDPEIIVGNLTKMNCRVNGIPGDEPVLWLGNEQVYCAVAINIDRGSGNKFPVGDGSPNGGEVFEFPENTTPGLGFGRIDCGAMVPPRLMSGIDANGDPICTLPP